MKPNRKVLLISSAAVLILAVSIGATLAFSSAITNSKTNSFQKGVPGIEIIENNSSTPGGSNSVDPSQKEVKVENTGTIPAYVRVMLVPGYKSAANVGLSFNTMPQSIGSSATAFTMGDLKLNLDPGWSSKWFYVYDSTDKIGYFYYKEILPPGRRTAQPLLASVGSVDPTKSNIVISSVQVDVITDSIQAEGGAVGNVWTFVKEDTNSHTISKK
ncbi:MAG TPA: hypothetical protein VHP54_02965 [Caproiciproducens sp.]|nr:hypothetical protein [Caproiciproducens sp.]